MNQSSSDNLYDDTSAREKKESGSFVHRDKSLKKDTSYNQRDIHGEKAQAYISNYNYLNGGDAYYQRRKQPRQTKKYLDYSRDGEQNVSRYTESDDEIDAITNEEIGEHSSEEAPFRQPIHQTKSTLQLLKISSESSLKEGAADLSALDTIKPDKTLQENYKELMKFEPLSDPRDNIYNPIRNVSPQNQSSYQNSASDDFTSMYKFYDAKSKSSPKSSVISTKPLALRKRNREPYNPYPEELNYPKMEEYTQQENWPRTTSNREAYENRKDMYAASNDRNYVRDPYYAKEGVNLLQYERMNRVRSERYYNRDANYISPSSRHRLGYGRDNDYNRYARDQPTDSDYRRHEEDSYPASRRKATYNNYARY